MKSVVTTEPCGAEHVPGTASAYLHVETLDSGERRIYVLAGMTTAKATRHGFAEVALPGGMERAPVEVRQMTPLTSGGWLEVDAAEIPERTLRAMSGDISIRFVGRRGTHKALLPAHHHQALLGWLAADGS